MTTDGTTDDASGQAAQTVLAAGGVVVDDTSGRTRVLVIHRPTYADWSLPKGHVDAGESLADAALREVLEETGVLVEIIDEAGITEHRVTRTRTNGTLDATKRVHWFTMRPADGADDPSDRTPDAEVDVATWWAAERALTDLTHAGERQLLARVLDVRVGDGVG